MRQAYPTQLAQIETECRKQKGFLSWQVFHNQGQPKRVSFTCWDKPKGKESRQGSWLGTLPLSKKDTSFVQPWVCDQADFDCASILPRLKKKDIAKVKLAEFECAMRNGTLIIAKEQKKVDVRCGFFATSLIDDNGDGEVDNEDQVSVDISVAVFNF